MSKQHNALDAYTKLQDRAKSFFKKNQNILTKWETLQNEISQAENAVKMETREMQTSYSNKQYKVTYSPAWKKWYDVDFLFNKANPKVVKLIKLDCLKQEIDKVAFEQLVEQGQIPVELQQEAFREQPMTARVLIKPNEN